MSIAMWNEIEALKRRVAALERAQAASRKPLLDQAAANHAAGQALRSRIREVIVQHPGQLRAKQVLALLDLPDSSLRRVQELLKEFRAESSASR